VPPCFIEMGISLTFCPGCLWIVIFLISTSWVAGITDMSYPAWPDSLFLKTNSLSLFAHFPQPCPLSCSHFPLSTFDWAEQ
jgi:hypothetical protein